MKAGSFKLKIALLTVLLSGAVLLGFGLFAVSVIHRIGLTRIDRELQALGDAQVRRPQPLDHWPRFDNSLGLMYGHGARKQVVIEVTDTDGANLYVSEQWPAGLTSVQLGTADSGGTLPLPAGPRNPPLPPAERIPPGPPRPEGEGIGPPPIEERQPGPPPRMMLRPPTFLTVAADGRTWRFAVLGNEEINLAIGQDLASFYGEINQFGKAALIAMPLALLLLAAAGWLLARQALRPVRVLTQVAARITARGLDQRVPAANADAEFRALVDVINDMLNRLEHSYQQAVRFSADAAHELKTPLTILQGQLEQALQTAPSLDEQRHYAELLEEVQRLKVIVRKLLLLAQADSGQLKLSLERTDLGQEIEAQYDDARLLAPGLTMTKSIAPDTYAMADPDLIRQALQNLISNAVKYNHAGGTIDFCLRQEGPRAVFTIANSIDPNTRIDPARLFERFYRGDSARNRAVDGVGLGLSLAREIARAHQGDLVLHEIREDTVSFVLALPTAG